MYEQIDNLTYTYDAGNTGNRLMGVKDASDANYGFVMKGNGTSDYSYDANGNMTRDANKLMST